ncbi:MAG: helix-turn-helix transcriptional regulator [Acidiferrobacteraceae bacterium]
MTLAERMRYARERADLSQSALARQVGLRPQTVQAIEAGAVRRPRALMELARILGVRSEWLLWDEGAMHEPAVQESPSDYHSGGVAHLSEEAVTLARDWMALSRAERDALKEVIRALRVKHARPPGPSGD